MSSEQMTVAQLSARKVQEILARRNGTPAKAPLAFFSNGVSDISPVSTTADCVIRRGKVFECGSWPDKDFSLTPEEARQAVANFTPCPCDLEHRDTILSGHLGTLTAVSLGDDGRTIFGTITEPKWLSDLLPNGERKVSLAWDKAKKKIVGVGHVLSPAIPDAAVFNAYAKFSKGESVTAFAYESAAERDKIPAEDYGDPDRLLYPCRTQQEFRECMRELAFAEDPTAVKKRLLEIAERKGLNVNDYEWPYYQSRGVSKPLDSDAMFTKGATPAETVSQMSLRLAAEILAKRNKQ